MSHPHELLQNLLDKSVDGSRIVGLSFALSKGTKIFTGCSGNLVANKPFFIASTTKLFTTAIILQLSAEGRLSLEDGIAKILSPKIISGLHVYKGKEFTQEICIRHLLSHTSGLADYFQDKQLHKGSLEQEIKAGKDRGWTFEDIIELNAHQKAFFAPGTSGKAHYSDTNFQLLGKIIEEITGISFEANCFTRIIEPLGLKHTYIYNNSPDQNPMPLYYKSDVLHIPLAMSSFGPDGGMVSTAEDLLAFIRAFFQGELFPQEYLKCMQVWNRIFFPLQAGLGIHLFKLPWFFNPFGTIPPFIGHSGLSGALAFYCPGSDLYIAGTVNQVASPDKSFRLMIQLERLSKNIF